MAEESILESLSEYGIIPVIAIDSVKEALPLADALIEGGLPVAEITFRTKAAADAMRLIGEQRPQLILGAGTVLNVENLRAAKDCGARFAVAPGLNPLIVQEAKAIGLPFIPGVATPSDIEQGLALGCSLLKYFPAGALGGVEMLKALSGPYAHTGVRFVPTGGVNPGNLSEYLAQPTVAAVGGTWLAKKEHCAQGDWPGIIERCKTALSIVASLRK